jgi:hypothetical protein
VVGSLTFVVCALQVYLGKIFKWGVASGGLYLYIRHHQYLALGIWGVGMSILWPRFIVLVSLSVMLILYYFLARDEEKRMVAQYSRQYEDYMGRTGMFLPKPMERWFSFAHSLVPRGKWRYVIASSLVIFSLIGGGAILREITLRSLSFETQGNLTLLSMLPEDNALGARVVSGILKNNGGLDLAGDKDYLGYIMPVDYIMQGMIADTGGEFHLYKKHHTVGMINEWVLHPFQHLRDSPSLHMAQMHHVDPAIARRHHCPIGPKEDSGDCNSCSYRRVIIVEIKHVDGGHLSGADLFALNTTRIPVSFVDINAGTGEIINAVKVQKPTAWQDVPTPGI